MMGCSFDIETICRLDAKREGKWCLQLNYKQYGGEFFTLKRIHPIKNSANSKNFKKY